jgi:hypothetical protein
LHIFPQEIFFERPQMFRIKGFNLSNIEHIPT